MAGGYLGKISAVISANTGDYVRGLNEGAKATRDFAKTVQSTLNRSASDAARAFEGIYTPLQQFERAIRQAGQLRLNFKGFEGAVRNINDLQKRLNGVLTNNEIDLVVRTSGLRDIEAVRQAINSLSEKEITLSANAGGLPGLLKARAELERSGAGATTIINTKATQAELDSLIEKLNVLDDRKIDLIIDVVNQRGLNEAITRARELQDVATQIAAPLAVASAEFAKLSQSAQGQFVPALGAAQRAVEQFKADIDQLGPAGRRAFQDLKADVDLVRASISRLSEVQSLTSGLFTGRELTFVNPEIVDTLNRLQAAQRQLASAPAAVRGSPIGQEVVADAQVLQEQLNRVLARVERIRAEGGQITFSQRGLDVILQRLRQVTEETSQVSSEPVMVAASARGAEENDTARLINRARAEAELENRRVADARRIQDQEIAILRYRAQAEADAENRRAAAAQRAEDQEIAVLRYRAQAEAEIENRRVAAAQRAEDQEIAILRYRAQAEAEIENRRAAAAQRAEDDEIARLVNRERAALERDRAEQRTFPAREGDPQGAFGPSFQPFIENLRRDIAATRIDLERLDGPLREQLGPEVTRINNQFGLLARQGIATSADEARRLSREIAAINTSFANRRNIGQEFSQRFGGAGAAGLGLGVDQRSLNAVGGQIEFVQQRLARLGAEARGPTLEALQRFRAVAQRLFDAGTIDTEGGRRELEALRRELAQTLSAAGGGSRRSITQGLSRAGDVARGGFDRFSLGIQQAAFAVEDFFSVTGGLDQRVRAAGNNISQLGFILGGTSGLIAGIAGAIGSQLIVALIKWANAGRTTEDSIKAVSDVLSRQKSIVAELSQAFDSLGDSIVSSAFSSAAKDANEFSDALGDIRKKQQELRDQQAFSLDEGVLRARADVSVAENRLAGASTRDAAVSAQRQLLEAQQRLRQEEDRVRNRPELTLDGARRAVDAALARQRDSEASRAAAATAASGGGAAAAQGARDIAFRQGELLRTQVAGRLAGLNDPGAVRDVLREEQAAAAARGDNRLAAQLEEIINSLESPASKAIDELARAILEGASGVSRALGFAQDEVSKAIEAGVPSAITLRASLDAVGEELKKAKEELRTIQEQRFAGSIGVDEARRRTVDVNSRISQIQGQRDAILARADAVRFVRTVNSPSGIESRLSRASANLNAANTESGQLARRLRQVEFARETIRQQIEQANPQDTLTLSILARAQEQLNAEAAAIEAATIAVKKFTDALNRATQEAAANLDSARQQEQQARSEDLGFSTPQSREARSRAESLVASQEQANARVEDAVAVARARLEEQAANAADPLSGTFSRLRDIQEQLANGGLPAAEQERLIEERRRLQDRIDAAIQQEQSVIDARNESTRLSARAQLEAEGARLRMGEGERARAELDRQLAAVQADANAQIAAAIKDGRFGDIAGIQREQQNDQARLIEDAARQQAPAIFALADSVQNAILQGPSRAAMTATDVSTVEGSRELTRLLRGDDAARNQDLVQLQRQSVELLRVIANNPAPVAN